MSARFRREERRRLALDITLRHRISDLDQADDLIIRLLDTIEQIKFDLSAGAEYPIDDFDDDQAADWRVRAQRAVARFELILSQVQRRRDMLERMKKT